MRMLALPAALLLGAALYTNFPQAEDRLFSALRALLEKIRRLFTSKSGKTDERSALAVFFLLLAAAATLLSALHPAAAALLTAPVFSGFSVLPAAAKTKQALDSGAFSKDVSGYERRVLEACAPMGEAFAHQVVAPMLLFTLGAPLHLGCTLCWLYAAARALPGNHPAAQKLLCAVRQAGEGAMIAMLLLCAGLVGRNPLRIGGRGVREKLMRILSLQGEIDHAPIAGDITQAIFLCCLSAGLWCFLLTFIGFVLV